MDTEKVIAAIDQRIAELQTAAQLLTRFDPPEPQWIATGRPTRTISPEGKERIAAAQRKRWAKSKTEKPSTHRGFDLYGKKRSVSVETKARMAAAQKARWAQRKQQTR